MINEKLKQILSENSDVKKIQVKYPQYYSSQVGFVVDANFDKQTRSIVFLSITQSPKPRSDKFHLIKTFLFDLRGTHEILAKDLDTNAVYKIGTDYTTAEGVLTITLSK